MNTKNRLIAAFMVLAACISLIIPIYTLFMGDGVFAWYLPQRENHRMLLEILLLAVLLEAVFLLISDSVKRLLCAAAVCTVFCWLHVIFLPMVLSGLYTGYILLAGGTFRRKMIRDDLRYAVFADFLLGAALIIAEFCLLSAVNCGSIPVLKTISLIQGGLLYGAWFYRIKKNNKGVGSALRAFSEKSECFFKGRTGISRLAPASLFMLLFLSVLIQIGKMNISLDFDTLWYGVRSPYILDPGNGIYENPGLVGMAYVYSKGLEVLLLPLSDLASYSYLLFFNIWSAVLGLLAVYRTARFYMGGQSALLAAALAGCVPGIMNMSISAKTDIVTWLLQLIMIIYLLHYLKDCGAEKRKPVIYLILAAGAYLLSLTMKPTSLVFSTAVSGMSGLYLIFSRKVSFRAPVRHWFLLLPPAAALTGIWARTMMITGMPVMSVFTSVFKAVGFSIRYPFATGSLPQNWQDESSLHVLVRRLVQMLLAPEGKDMGHVVIAWGTSLMFFLLCCFLMFSVAVGRKKREKNVIFYFTHVVFWPFLAVNLVSLVMLYQVDGNYFLLLYTAVIVAACTAFGRLEPGLLRRWFKFLLAPVIVLCILISAESSWAWSLGFSEIQVVNKGRINHRAMQHETMINAGNAEIWNMVSEDPQNRLIAFGDHPFSLQFPCNVQSYKDITAPWGNVELVNSPEAFEEYMSYAKTDYIYVQAGFIGENSWSWSYGLLKQMIGRGSVTDLYFENGNVLARVNRDSSTGKILAERTEKSDENLSLFMEHYRTAG